jgi:hypothetical protein
LAVTRWELEVSELLDSTGSREVLSVPVPICEASRETGSLPALPWVAAWAEGVKEAGTPVRSAQAREVGTQMPPTDFMYLPSTVPSLAREARGTVPPCRWEPETTVGLG